MASPADPSETVEALSRRGVVRGAAVGGLALPLLVACGGDEEPATDDTGSADGGDGGGDGGGDSAPGAVTVAQADVPVGGGTVLGDDGVVVTQPTEGDFKAFTAVCTHQQCTVADVTDGTINCGCHGSQFSAEDGSVVSGPAAAPLAAKTVTVEGEDVVVG